MSVDERRGNRWGIWSCASRIKRWLKYLILNARASMYTCIDTMSREVHRSAFYVHWPVSTISQLCVLLALFRKISSLYLRYFKRSMQSLSSCTFRMLIQRWLTFSSSYILQPDFKDKFLNNRKSAYDKTCGLIYLIIEAVFGYFYNDVQ